MMRSLSNRPVMPSPQLAAAALALALLPAPGVLAQPALEEIAGAWECRLPGQVTRTPPILWIAAAPAGASQSGPELVEIDGFAGAVRGEGRLAAGAGGWSRIEEVAGAELWLKPASDGRRPGLLARLGGRGAPYACRRLPYPPVPNAPAV